MLQKYENYIYFFHEKRWNWEKAVKKDEMLKFKIQNGKKCTPSLGLLWENSTYLFFNQFRRQSFIENFP